MTGFFAGFFFRVSRGLRDELGNVSNFRLSLHKNLVPLSTLIINRFKPCILNYETNVVSFNGPSLKANVFPTPIALGRFYRHCLFRVINEKNNETEF